MSAAEESAEERAAVVKARLLGMDLPHSKEGGEIKTAFSGSGALVPPYDPDRCLFWCRNSQSLRPNIEALATNVDGFGHRFEAGIRLNAKGAEEKVADAILARRYSAGDDDPPEPTAEEVGEEMARLARRARVEKAKVASFFRHASHDGSFVRLRRRTRVDLEATGNAYWEVIRNGRGEPARFKFCPSYLTRLLPLGCEWVEVEEWEQVSPVDFEPVKVPRRLRRYVQIDEVSGELTYFREFRDPRTMSPRTGRYYESPEALAAEEPGVRPANELIHFRLDWPDSPYGIPRWVGAMFEVMGDNAQAEVNYLLFDNKSVPPVALLVSGGRLADGADEEIKTYIQKEIKGRKNWNKILVIEAESDGKSGTAPRVEIVPLAKNIPEDALFLAYSERAKLTVGGQYRIPRILRGDTNDFNRATAEAALEMAEDQVFAPEREDFDFFVNTEILPLLGIFFWRFRSLTPSTRNPERLADGIDKLGRAGALVPRDMREIAADVFNRDFEPIDEPWQDRPIAFTLAGIQTGREGGETQGEAGAEDLDAKAADLLGIRQRLQAREAELAERRAKLAREHLEPEILEVPKGEFRRWFESQGEK